MAALAASPTWAGDDLPSEPGAIESESLDLALGLVRDHNAPRGFADVPGLDLALGYTLVGQVATEVEDGKEGFLTGSFDFPGAWELVQHERFGRGGLYWLVEGGHVIDGGQDDDLSANVGSVLGLNGDLNGEAIMVTELGWAHSVGSVGLTVGKVDPTGLFDANRVANDETAQFLSGALVNNVAVPFPDSGLGAYFTVEIVDTLCVQFGAGDFSADARTSGFDAIDDGEWFGAVEFDLTAWKQSGTYRLLGWFATPGHDVGAGIALSFDQELVPDLVLFGRLGYGDPVASDFEFAVSGGLGLEAPFGRPSDLVGIGAAWGEPSVADVRDETLLEAFYRLHLLEVLELTPVLQLVFAPAEATHSNTVVVFGLRSQLTF